MSASGLSLSERPPVHGLNVVSDLRHFAIISYAIPAMRIRPLIPNYFELETIQLKGQSLALLSAVPFLNTHFRSACWPGPRFQMGQTNYRVYIRDPEGRRAVWFLGTVLDSWTIFIPRNLWKMPWHPGQMRFECTSSQYQLKTLSKWAPMQVKLSTTQEPPQYPGFDSPEDGRLCLTHPLVGYYCRRDGQVGSYSIWHAPLELQTATVSELSIDLFRRLGLVSPAEQQAPYSVLILDQSQFTIYLPPKQVQI